MKYEYILIDLDDTIFDFIECEKVALINTLKSFGYNLNTDKTKIFSSINEKYFNKYANKNMTRDEFHKKDSKNSLIVLVFYTILLKQIKFMLKS